MFSALLLVSLQGAFSEIDAANLSMVQCYFSVVRTSSESATAAELDSTMSETCAKEEALVRMAGGPRLLAKGKSAQEAVAEIDELIRSVRSGLAADAERWRTQSVK